MKICAVVAEYNPFHNGHRYLLQRAKELSGADKFLVVMSGNFTQRGEVALLNKYKRAEHAVLNGADAVIELPALFATAPAEIFARGAIKLLTTIPSVTTLAFGCEDDNATLLNNTARLLSDEPKGFKTLLKEKLKSGLSLVRARTEVLSELNEADVSFLNKPNNILGLEYTKAIRQYNSSIQPLPIKRVGANYKDESVHEDLSSASAIRANRNSKDKKVIKMLRSSLPECVFADLPQATETDFKKFAVYALHLRSADELKRIVGCTEGLENRFKALLKDSNDYDDIVEKMTSKRYTASRLRRILLSAFLSFTQEDIATALQSDLYLKVLAVKREGSEELLSALHDSSYPLITRKRDAELLKKGALSCFEKDVHAGNLYNFLTGSKLNEYFTLFV